MRRSVGLLLTALGVGLLTLGIALQFWAYPRLAHAAATYPTAEDAGKNLDPPAQDSVSTGKVSVFVAREGQPIGPQNLDAVATRTTVGQAADGAEGKVFYESSVRLIAPSLGPEPVNVSIVGVCFDDVSGAATEGCARTSYRADAKGAVVEDVAYAGQVFKFPFHTRRHSYQFWDGTLGKAAEITYQGDESLDGLTVYRFAQDIPETVVGTQTGMPATLFGGAAGESVDADIVYANKRTVWVEPETGAIIKGVEEQRQVFRAEGKDVDKLVGTLGYSDATVARNIDLQSGNASALRAVRGIAFPLGVGLGLVLTVIGVVLVFARERGEAGSGDPDVIKVRRRVTDAG